MGNAVSVELGKALEVGIQEAELHGAKGAEDIDGKDQKEAEEINNEMAFEKRGVTLRLLQIVRDLALLKKEKSFWSIGALSAHLNGNHEILQAENRWGNIDASRTLTYSAQSSLVDMLRKFHSKSAGGIPHPQLQVTYDEVVGEKANIFLSFAYSSNYVDMVDAIEHFMLKKSSEFSPESTYFWFDVFVNDQWHALDKPFEWWASTFKEAVQDIGFTLCYFSSWERPTYVTRVWTLFELSCSTNLHIALSGEQRVAFYETLKNRDTIQSKILGAVGAINLQNATSYLPEDKERIFDVIQKQGGFHQFDIRVMGMLSDWVKEALGSNPGIVEGSIPELKAQSLVQTLEIHAVLEITSQFLQWN